jgi:PAS domain S-box-containing protein
MKILIGTDPEVGAFAESALRSHLATFTAARSRPGVNLAEETDRIAPQLLLLGPDLEAIVHIRERYPALPVIVVVEDLDIATARTMLAAGATDCVRAGDAVQLAIAVERARSAVAQTSSGLDPERKRATSADAILVMDADQRVITYNQPFLELWGFTASTIAESSADDRLAHMAERIVDPLTFIARARYLAAHPGEHNTDEFALKDGRIFERTSGPMRSKDPARPAQTWFLRDVTARHQHATTRTF